MTKFSSTPRPSRDALYTAMLLMDIGTAVRHDTEYHELRRKVEGLLLIYEPEHAALLSPYAPIHAYTKINVEVSRLINEYQVWLNLRSPGPG